MPAVRTFVPKPLPRADLDWRALVPSIGRATLGDVLRFEAGEPARDEDRR